jgi:hypothetical protein
MLVYDNETCNQFVEDMEAYGYEVEHYRGRNFWEGPSVVASDPGEVAAQTSVTLQHDGMGKDYVIYPRRSGKLIETAGGRSS